MKRTTEWALVAALIVGLSLIYGCIGGPHPLVGQIAPDIELKTLAGETKTLAAHRGKDIVVVDFWATWCPPCRKGLPILDAIANDYAGKGVAVYAVNLGETDPEVAGFLDAQQLGLTVLMDRGFFTGRDYEVEGIPQTVLIDKEGRVQAVHVGVGMGYADSLRREIDRMLAGEPLVKAEA